MLHYQHIISLFFSVLLAAQGLSSDKARSELSDAIDQLIDQQLTIAAVTPAPVINDYAFARRATLDLAGRIPTLTELKNFVNSTSPNKRVEYVDHLLDSIDFAHHLRDCLDVMLLAAIRHDSEWRDYLLQAALENRSWDQILQEIVLPDRKRPDDKGAAAFLHARAKELDLLTNDVSVLLFGINIACAKCHDHPLVDDWQQKHYFGLASFFERTYPTQSGLVLEKFDGRIKFTSTSGQEQQADFMFLTGESITEVKEFPQDAAFKEINQQIREIQRNRDAPKPPLPEFSPRSELVRLALAPSQQHFLSRNMVNRTWERLMGQGLVHPLDQMHSENPATHPAIIDLLASDFVEHGYDLKRLIRNIVLTSTYARSSHWLNDSEPPSSDFHARGLVRPLAPRQLALSLFIATRNPEHLLGLCDPQRWKTQRQELDSRAEEFTGRFPLPTDGFQVATDEAMHVSNSPAFQNAFLGTAGDQIVDYLSKMQNEEELIVTAYLTIVSRPPTEAEIGAVGLHLAQRRERKNEAVEQLVWALLASPETRFNH